MLRSRRSDSVARTFIACLLAFLMVFSAFPAPAIAEILEGDPQAEAVAEIPDGESQLDAAEDDSAELREQSTQEFPEMTLEQAIDVSIEEGGYWIGSFTVPSDGTYTFFSSGTSDTYGELYSDERLSDRIDTNDDGGENNNFSIKHALDEGQTVYLKVRQYSNGAATFTVSVETIDTYDLSLAQFDVAQGNYVFDGSPIHPNASVTDASGRALSEGTDYVLCYRVWETTEVFYDAPAEVGHYTVCAEAADGSEYRGRTEWRGFYILAANNLATASVEYSSRNSYTGSPVDVGFTLTLSDGTILSEGTDYTLVYRDSQTGDQLDSTPSDTGSYFVQAQAIQGSGYEGTTEWLWFEIYDANDISSFGYSTGETDFIYDGEAHQPTVSSVRNNLDWSVLEYDVDYTFLEFRDESGSSFQSAPTEVGSYYAVYKGIGLYHGELIVSFRILDRNDLETASLSCAFSSSAGIGSTLAYTGSPVAIETTVKTADNTTLSEGVHFELAYYRVVNYQIMEGDRLDGAPTDIGEYAFRAEAVEGGGYTGKTHWEYFSIVLPNDLALASVEYYGYSPTEYAYTGSPIEPEIFVTAFDGTMLFENVHYRLVFFDSNHDPIDDVPTEIGGYYASIEAVDGGGYVGNNGSWRFEIVAENDLKLASFDYRWNYAYTGSPIEIEMTVTAPDGTVLSEGVHYRIAYFNESTGERLDGAPTEKGFYSAIVEAIDGGGYIGQVSRWFDISDPSDLRGASVEIKKSYAYTGSPIELDLTVTACDGTVLTEGTHYITKWVGPIGPGFAETGVGAPVEVGNYLVYIEAIDGGGYSGHTDPYDFSIVSADDFSAVSVDVLKSYVYTGNPVELEMDVTTFDGTELTEGIHYVPRWFDAKGIALDSAPTGTGRYVVYLEATDNGGYTGKSKPFTIEITPPEGVIAMGTWGTCPWEITSDGTLTVHPGEGAEQVSVSDSETYNSPWIEFADSITTVSFVEEGGRQVIAPSNASFLLYNLSNVTSADLSGLNTSGSESLSGFFAFCSSLTSLDLSDWDTSNVTKIDSMFFSCHSLVSLDVAGWNTSSVEDAAWLFNGCSSLTALNLSGWNTSAMKYMGYMFSSCSSLTSLNLSGWITSSMESAGLMFSGCSSLTSLNVSSWETSNATYLFGMFYGCSSLVSLDLSGWDTSHVFDMGSMFSGCSGLTTLYVGDLWSTESVRSSNDMFSGCTSLVGGNGTAFDASHTDAEYARIDADGAPGYLTSIPKIDISGFSYSGQDIDYDGATHEPVVTIWDDDWSELVYGVDYVFKEYRDDYGNVITAPSEVGSYRVVCRGIGSYGGELEIWFRIIDPYDISSFSISNYTDAIAYDGAPHEPTVTVWDTDWMELEYGVDYTLKEFRDDWGNILQGAPTEIGSYRAVYQGISPYRGELETWFNIVGPNDLSVASVAMSDRYEYTGSPVELGMTVTAADGTVLTEGVHYALVFEDGSTGEQLDGPPSETGDYYSVTAEAIDGSGYSGSTGRYYFRIIDAYDIAGFNYWRDGDSAIAYDGEQHEPSVTFRDYDGRELEYGVDCVIGEFRDSKGNVLTGAPSEVGEYIAVYQGIGSYHGEREVWFRIYDPFDLANCSAYSRDWRFAYDGAAHAPANVVMTTRPRTPSDSGTKLEPGTDYVFVEFRGEDGTSFQDAPIEVGEYRAVYRGIGSYHGELERNFRIYDPHDISNGFLELSSHNVAYTGSPVDPEASLTMPDGTSLTEGVHYVLRYEKNGRPLDGAPSGKGYYDVWAEAIDGGGYTGATWRNSFYIVAANDLALATIDVGQYYVYTGSPVELDIAVTMPHGTVLTEGVDYTLVYHDWRTGKRLDSPPTEIDRYDVEIVAVDGGAYTGSAGARNFSIVAANDLGLATVDVDRTQFPYTGAPIDPEVTVTMPDGTVLTEGVDYSLMWGYDRSDWVLDGAPTEVGEYWVHATAVDDGGYVGGGSQWIAITIIDSSKPIASGTWGTCPWEISYDGVLTVHPGVGASQVGAQDSPWASHADIITSVVFKAEGGRMVVAPKDSSRLFFRLSNVEVFDFSGFDTSSVANMSGMFGFCRALHEVDLSSWNTSSVTNMQGMFNECTALASLDLSRWNTSSVTDMGGMFMWCESLSSLEVSTWDTSSVKKMSSLFYGCHALTSLDLSGWDTSAVTDMTGMFACGAPDAGSALTTIFVGDTWSTDAVKKSDWMFNGRTSLVGGNGTAYDSNHIDAEYARIDKAGTPGYLTRFSKVDIKNATIAPIPDQTYTGSSITPHLTVTFDGRELVLGTDYTTKFFNNTEVGTAVILVEGMGKFEGMTTATFRIVPFFLDADPADTTNHGAEVDWMGRSGISMGYLVAGGREYRGLQTVARCDFAAFLYRLADLGDNGVRDDSIALTDAQVEAVLRGVRDCTPSTDHAPEIAWLIFAGISKGWGNPDGTVSFKPYATVARQDMAAFLYRYADLSDDGRQNQSPAMGTQSVRFSDVRHGDVANHAAEVEWLASVGVTRGWDMGGGTYEFRGTWTVARQDMAAFMYRLYAYLRPQG